MSKEPAVIISTVTAFLMALIGFGAAFGLSLDDSQRNAVIAVVSPAVAVCFLIGPVIRNFVFSPHTAQAQVSTAESQDAKGETVAPVAP